MTEMGQILLVEDDHLVRQLVVHYLDARGFSVETYADGTECWERLAETDAPPDALVLDVVLPGVDGFTLLKRVRNHDHYHDVPVVMLTACGSESDVMHAFDLGADDYLTKPFSPSEVSARLRRLL